MNTIQTAIPLPQISNEIDKLIGQKATGRLIIKSQEVLGEIHLFFGRLQYIIDRRHRVRRWNRARKQHCPHWEAPSIWAEEQPWEYALLSQGISKKQLDLEQVKAVIRSVSEEFLLENCYQTSLEFEWQSIAKTKSALTYCLTLSTAEIHPLFHQTQEKYQQWFLLGLDKVKPSLAPLITANVDPVSLPIAIAYLDGKSTIWDIAQRLQKSPIQIISTLLPLIENKTIQLQAINDLPTAFTNSPDQSVAESPSSPVMPKSFPNFAQKSIIACIDDSPVVVHNLKQILSPAGYEVLGIQEPMAGFGELIKHQPALILLDLQMPNANGYSICKFLRETPAFSTTPIIILTSQDTVIDRTRAKIAGATDFLTKPPKAKELLQLIGNFLNS